MNGPYGATFDAVYGEAQQQAGFSHARYQKAAGVFAAWMDDSRHGGLREQIEAGSEAARQQALRQMKRDYVGGAVGIPIVGFLLLQVVGAFISWLFQRWLDEIYPRGQGRAAE